MFWERFQTVFETNPAVLTFGLMLVVVMCCLFAGSTADDESEKMNL